MSFIKKLRKSKFFVIFIFILVYLFLYYNFYTCDFISQDEGYQLALNDWSFLEIIKYCANDYHVPLFAFLVKLFSYLPVPNLFAARVLLSLFVIMHFFVAFFPLERLTNRKVALLYSIIFLLSPFLPYYIMYVRMFSLANLNLFCVFIYALLVVRYNRKSDLIKLILASILACYSFLLSMCVTFLILIIIFMYSLYIKDYCIMRKFILCFIIVFLAFCPWIPILAKQFLNLQSGRYWSYFPLGISFFVNVVSVLIVDNIGRFCNSEIIWSIYICLLLFIILSVLYNKIVKKNENKNFILRLSIIIVILSLLGILFYTYIKEAFAFRYFSIVYSLVLFSVIYYFNFNNNFFVRVSFLLFLFLFIYNYCYNYDIISYESNYELNGLIDDIENKRDGDNIFVFHTFERSLEILEYNYLNDYENYILYDSPCEGQTNVLRDYSLFGDNVIVIEKITDLSKYTDSFYFINVVEGDSSGDCIFDYFNDYGWEYKLINTYFSGYNNSVFELYEIKS